MVPIYAELIDHDDPSFAKLPVLAIYSPFVIFPILILLKTIWSPYPFGRHSNRGALLDGGLRAKYQ